MKKKTAKRKSKGAGPKFVILHIVGYQRKGYYWLFIAENNEVVAVSEIYKTIAGCRKGIASLKTHAATARVDVETKP